MYSRSYGSVEAEKETTPEARHFPPLSVPPDYNGNLYSRRQAPEPPEEKPAPKEAPPKNAEAPPPPPKEKPPEKPAGSLGGILDRVSAEDLFLLGLMLAMVFGDLDSSMMLAVLLAVILL